MDTPYTTETDLLTENPTDKKRGFLRFMIDLLETLLLSIALFIGINAITARVLVDGYSMRPTLDDGQYILVNRMSYRSNIPEYGDIVVFHFPVDPDQDFIKRIIGLPGDEVTILDGQVSVNDNILNEPYIAATPQYVGQWRVPDGQFFVLGDNRNNSSDSHSWGAVPLENIIGKAVTVYWPPPDWKALRHIQVALASP